MKNYISTKTIFKNKLYEKFHEKKYEERLLERNFRIHNGIMSKLFCEGLMIYKYKNYILEAPPKIAKQVFFGIFNNSLKNKQFLKNFDIESYTDRDTLYLKENTKDTIFIDKYQILFFKFFFQSKNLFFKTDRTFKKQAFLALEAVKKSLSNKDSVIKIVS